MGGGGSSTTEQVRNRDPYTPEMLAMDSALYNQFMPMYQGYGADLTKADETYGQYGDKYNEAYSGLQGLTQTGQLPAGMTDTVNDYLTREMNRSLGSAMAENAGKGILNSSVTSKAIGEIGSSRCLCKELCWDRLPRIMERFCLVLSCSTIPPKSFPISPVPRSAAARPQ